MTTLRDYVSQLSNVASKCKTKEQLKKALDKWEAQHADDTVLSDIVIRPQIMAEIGGQLMVDVHETQRVELDRVFAFAAAETPIPPFLDLRWDEAIEAYGQMDIPREREFAAIVEEYSKRSKKIRELMLKQLRSRSYDLLIKSLEEGTTFREYSSDLTQFASALGVSIDNPSYLQNVFRTNLQTSYSAGRWRAMSDPDVIGSRPYWRYQSGLGHGTCDFCRMMHGRIFEIGNAATDILFPLCHYQSRSVGVSHTLKYGDVVEKVPPTGYQDYKGWDQDFAANPVELLRL